jgi:hypothetical protein
MAGNAPEHTISTMKTSGVLAGPVGFVGFGIFMVASTAF